MTVELSLPRLRLCKIRHRHNFIFVADAEYFAKCVEVIVCCRRGRLCNGVYERMIVVLRHLQLLFSK